MAVAIAVTFAADEEGRKGKRLLVWPPLQMLMLVILTNLRLLPIIYMYAAWDKKYGELTVM